MSRGYVYRRVCRIQFTKWHLLQKPRFTFESRFTQLSSFGAVYRRIKFYFEILLDTASLLQRCSVIRAKIRDRDIETHE